MVGMMAAISREKIAGLIDSSKFDVNILSKLDKLRLLNDELSKADPVLLSEFVSPLLDLLSDRSSPVRKFTAEMVGHIGLKCMEYIPGIVPVLITVLKDEIPAVARQAIRCGIDMFTWTLFKVAVQGLYASDLDSSLESSWAWMLKLRDEIYSLALQGTDGRSLLALKFMETVVLLYTPDPHGPSEAPPDQNCEGSFKGFNVSWLRGGHPILNVGDLSIEASQSVGLLLDQLRFPTVKSHSNLMIIVLLKSLSAIASKRPAFYGRILPVLLGLDHSSSGGKGIRHALKNAYHSCLNCTHPGAAPWRDRLVGALRELEVGRAEEAAVDQVSEIDGTVEGKDDLPNSQDDMPSNKALDSVHDKASRKRSGVPVSTEKREDENLSAKRVRSTLAAEGSIDELKREQTGTSSGSDTSTSGGDNGPVLQLVAMFGALVAQGENSVLEILISSISADLLAEVVMENMRNLPPSRPPAEGDREQLLDTDSNPSITGSISELKKLSSLLSSILLQPSVQQQDSQPLASNVLELSGNLGDSNLPGLSYVSEEAQVPVIISASSSEQIPSSMEADRPVIQPEAIDVRNVDDEIPGLDLSAHSDKLIISSGATELDDTSQEQLASVVTSPAELLPSVSTDRSEELSPKTGVTDISSRNFSSATSFGLPIQVALPKISAPVIDLTEEQKDNVQQMAYVRIIDAYKQIKVAGGSEICLSLLSYLAVKFPLELDPWKSLQTHIVADFVNHEGHELTLRVLYRLYGEAEEERDFFSSTTATSVYENFLLMVAETLRDSFPASDKSLSRLLTEVPYLPESIFKLLEHLCSPGSNEKDEESHSPDRLTQGLSIIWNLILLRPPIRTACLRIALQSAVHHLEEVRNKAIRLVANRLYPLQSISHEIEDFAKEQLLSVANFDHTSEINNADRTNSELQKDSSLGISLNQLQSTSASVKELASENNQLSASEIISSFSMAEGQRCMALYFALCTKKHSLFRQIFVCYGSMSKAAKQGVLHQIPILVRTIGSSCELLQIISDPPSRSEELLMQVLHILTDGAIPSPELLSTIRKLYDTKIKDIELLTLILPFLPKDEVLAIFPRLVNAPLEKFQVALSRILQGSTNSGPVITPAEALIAIHGIDPERDGIPLKKVTEACNTCFDQRQIFTQQVVAKVLNQLVEQIPLPLLFMRTVMQATGAFPSLVDFVMEILSRLVSKQIWKYPKLWVGFMKCALLTKPQSFGVLLQLPPAQLENALNRTPGLREPLIAHASQPNIRSSLPRSTLAVLGIGSESQSLGQVKATDPQSGDVGKLDEMQSSHAVSGDTSTKSDKESVAEKSKESSDAS